MAQVDNFDKEIEALKTVIQTLRPIDKDRQARILASIGILLGFVSADTCSAVIAEATERRRA